MNPVKTVEELEEALSRPPSPVAGDLAPFPGGILVLGVSGKMGPTLARMAVRAGRTVTGVARFSTPGVRDALERAGVRTIACDLLDRKAVARLPDAPLVLFLAGMKFGSSASPATTWAMNTHVPALVAERFRDARIVCFSSGNIYPFVPVDDGGATERTPPAPVGEYAQSVLGRERIFEYFSARHGTPVAIVRLNYAVELRYGVLLDLAEKVRDGEPIDLEMGYVNVIWQGDANAAALRCLALAGLPPRVVNVAGPETLSVRDLANRLGKRLDRTPRFEGRESDRALLNAGSDRFGPPTVPVDRILDWVAEWVRNGGPTLGKPTRYEATDGNF